MANTKKKSTPTAVLAKMQRVQKQLLKLQKDQDKLFVDFKSAIAKAKKVKKN